MVYTEENPNHLCGNPKRNASGASLTSGPEGEPSSSWVPHTWPGPLGLLSIPHTVPDMVSSPFEQRMEMTPKEITLPNITKLASCRAENQTRVLSDPNVHARDSTCQDPSPEGRL